jgi:transposase InsO family protein
MAGRPPGGFGHPKGCHRLFPISTPFAYNSKRGLEKYVTFYNQQRPHRALDGKTPDEYYFDNLPALPNTA